MTGCRDMDKKHQKYPKNGDFPQSMTPKGFFLKNLALSIVYPYGAPTSAKQDRLSMKTKNASKNSI